MTHNTTRSTIHLVAPQFPKDMAYLLPYLKGTLSLLARIVSDFRSWVTGSSLTQRLST